MKVLIVCSGNTPNFNFALHQAFIYEQVHTISRNYPEINFDYFFIQGTGIKGYLNNLKRLKKQIKTQKFDIIHAHYGLSGALSVLQRKIPVVITFHNGETLAIIPNLISSFASLFAAYSIYVAKHIYLKSYFKRGNKSMILPCGINLSESVINIQNKHLYQKEMHIDETKINILFGGAFDNLRKNYNLAKKSCILLQRDDINIIELKGYNREQVTKLLIACDLAILPSNSEGSPQFIKEAMACNRPIVATNVGDIEWLFGETEGCYLTSFDPNDVADKLKLAMEFSEKIGTTKGRDRLMELNLDSETVAKKIMEVYKKVLSKNR